MGQISYTRIIIVIICFALAGNFVHHQTESKVCLKRSSLSQALSDLQGWKGSGPRSIDREIVEALELDDYLNQRYSNSESVVSLYVGYYLTAKKVGAAHSPLVCFPGQGWVVSNRTTKSIISKDLKIDLSVMVATKGQERNLILFWFQAFDKTCPGTFLQKVYTFWSKVIHSREDNAFVRVSVPMKERSMEEAYNEGKKFIKAFYPRFLEYIKDQNITHPQMNSLESNV